MSAEITITYYAPYDGTPGGWRVEVNGLSVGTNGEDGDGHPDFWHAFQEADKWCDDRGHDIWRVTLEASLVGNSPSPMPSVGEG